MSALAGLWYFDGRAEAASGCARMLAAQEIYGPHAQAQWAIGDLAMGRRLMRLLPEDAFDQQPLVGGDGRFVLVADLRLDNRDELVDRLRIPRATAGRLSDAAVLLAAIERWEENCLEHLIGDYAFALWDSARRRLLLARDPMGMRPLLYHRGRGFFAFASMAKGLHALAEVPYGPDEETVAEFVVLLPETGTRTFFQGIERVQPAHRVTITAGDLSTQRFWRPKRRSLQLRGPDDYVEKLRELLDEAVRCRLRGASDIAATLSGGLDSSAVAATAARLLATTGGRVVAYTGVPRAGYDGPNPPGRVNDEGPFAAATAAMYPNMEHILIHAPGRSPLDDLDRFFFLAERPMLGICNLGWQIRMITHARERKLGIMLGGAMGNVGLSYDGKAFLPELFRRGHWIRWWREASALVGHQGWSWPHAVAETLGPWFPGPAWTWILRTRRADNPDVFDYTAINPNRFAELNLARRAREAGKDFSDRPAKDGFEQRAWCLERSDPGPSLKGVLGGWQLDVREPLSDLRMLEFCLSVPMEQYLRGGTTRALARRTIADRVPKIVVEKRRSGMDGADWHERLTAARTQVVEELARLSECPSAARALDLPRLLKLVENWPTAGWERLEVSSPYRLALLRALSTGHFLRRTTGANR